MPAYAFEGLIPVVDPTSFVHPTASLIGDVIIGPGCYIGPGASLRGDFGRIVVTGDASVQDNCTLHSSAGLDCVVGFAVTVGHAAILHGCTVEDHALIGMNAVVLDEAVIGRESLVGAQSLVKSDMRSPPRSLIVGNPARVVREIPESSLVWKNDEYKRLAARSLADFCECEPLTAPETDRKRPPGNATPVRLKLTEN